MNVSRFQKTLQIGRIGSGMCVLLLFAILHTDALQTAVYAGPPRTLSYQGLLTNENGESVPDGEYRLSFSLYDVEEEGDALWTESQTVVVEKGIFSALLGSEIPMDLLFDKPYWLEIKVGVDPELTPRIALTSTAYSFRSLKSQNADSVNGISASATPAANSLYPLGPDGKFPQSVLPAGHSGGAHAETHQEGGTDPLTVTGGMIQDGSVDTDNLADDAVTAAKILPDVLSSLDGVVN
ncbi:hypothetical protein JW835_08470, partial [bacterium]|nr:hypothetical protein [bacterium]